MHDGPVTDDWAAPGTSAAQPRPVSHVAERVTPSPASVERRQPRPLPLRPQTVLELLDSGFAIVRSRPALVLGVAAVFHFPLALTLGFLQRNEPSRNEALLDDVRGYLSTSTGTDTTNEVIALLIASLIHTVVAVAVGLLVSAWYSERDPDLKDVLGWMVRHLPTVTLAWLLVHLLQAAGLVALGVGALIAAVFTTVVAPVLAVERVGPIDAIRRSVSMVRARFSQVLAFFVLSIVVGVVMTGVLTLAPAVLAAQFVIPVSWLLMAIGAAVAGTVSAAVLASATVALYIDLRVRLEGIDLQLLVTDRFPPP